MNIVSDAKSTYILYVEDDEGLARLLQKDLQRSGCAVDIAHDGEKGLKMMDEGSCDVLLVDYKLPMYGGFDVVRKLASRGTLLPTIMITGYGSEKLAVEAMKLGVADYVVKDTEMIYLELRRLSLNRCFSSKNLSSRGSRRSRECVRARSVTGVCSNSLRRGYSSMTNGGSNS